MKRFLSAILTVLVIGIGALACLSRLNASALENWDEAFYADGMRHLLINHDPVVPFWNHSAFLDKPPLHIWIGTVGLWAIGDSSAGYRFTSAVFSLLCVMMVYFFSRQRFGTAPAIAAFCCVISNSIFIWRGREANTDALLTFLMFLVFLFSLKSFRGKYLVLGFLLSLIYMTKSTIVVFPIAALGVMELIELWEKRAQLQTIFPGRIFSWIGGVFAALLLPVLWLTAGYLQMGKSFVIFYLFLSDYGTSGLSLSYLNLSYALAAVRSLGVLSLVVGAGWLGAILTPRSRLSQALLVFGLPLPLALSFSPTQNNWYLMPIIPIWAMAAAYAVWLCKEKMHSAKGTALLVGVIVIAASYQFYQKVLPIYFANSAYHQAEAGRWLEIHTQPDVSIVRLDQVYPTLVFYSQRRTFVSTADTPTDQFFLSKTDLLERVQNGTLRWISGTHEEVETFSQLLLPHTFIVHRITDQESVLEVPQTQVY